MTALETLIRGFEAWAGPDPGRILFLGARPHPSLAGGDVTPVQPWAGIMPGAAPFAPEDEIFDTALVLPGKARGEIRAALGRAVLSVRPGGRVIAALSNDLGAARYEKEFAALTGQALFSLSKHKARAFGAEITDGLDAAQARQWLAEGAVQSMPDGHYLSRPGLFSWDRVDPGSAALAETPEIISGTVAGGIVADWGCGWGYLSCRLIARGARPDKLILVDADARALDCAERNLRPILPGGTELETVWADAAGTGAIHEKADRIVMNPPFHPGGGRDHMPELGRAMLRSAAHNLKRGGEILLVANARLPYETMLKSLFPKMEKLYEAGGYKILRGIGTQK